MAAAFVVECEKYGAQYKIAYCLHDSHIAPWPLHRTTCEKYGADKAITDDLQRFMSNFTRMVDSKVFKRGMSDTMKQRGFATRRGALGLKFKTLEEMDDAAEKLSQREVCKLSMAFFELGTFRKSGARPEVIRDMETYPLDRKFFVYMQTPAGGGKEGNLMNFVLLPYLNDE